MPPLQTGHLVLYQTVSFGFVATVSMACQHPDCRLLQRLEHDPEKWMPVFRKDHAPTKKLDHDPIQFDRIMV
jgi:hypothetical protein